MRYGPLAPAQLRRAGRPVGRYRHPCRVMRAPQLPGIRPPCRRRLHSHSASRHDWWRAISRCYLDPLSPVGRKRPRRNGIRKSPYRIRRRAEPPRRFVLHHADGAFGQASLLLRHTRRLRNATLGPRVDGQLDRPRHPFRQQPPPLHGTARAATRERSAPELSVIAETAIGHRPRTPVRVSARLPGRAPPPPNNKCLFFSWRPRCPRPLGWTSSRSRWRRAHPRRRRRFRPHDRSLAA